MYQGRLYFYFQGMAKWNMDQNRTENYKACHAPLAASSCLTVWFPLRVFQLADKFWPAIKNTSKWAPYCFNTNLVY